MTKFILTTSLLALLAHTSLAISVAPNPKPLTTSSDPIMGVQLSGSTLTEATAGGGPNQNSYPANEGPALSIDGSATSKYLNFARTNTGIIVDAANDELALTTLQLTTGNDAAERDPASFSIYGSNVSQSLNFADYIAIILDQPILANDPGRQSLSETVSFPNSTVYDSYLVVFPTVRNGSFANSMQVSEIQLSGVPVPEPTTLGLLGMITASFAGFRRRR